MDTEQKMNEKQSYLNQIDKYYNHKLSRFDFINVGATPDILVAYGAKKLPMTIQQSILTKCTRKQTGSRSAHELSRDIIEKLPEQIEKPIFLIQDKKRGSVAIIADSCDKNGNNILVAIKLNESKEAIKVNAIKSIYGKTNLKEYLQKHIELQQLHIVDNKKAEMLSRLVGFQLPQALIASSYNNNLSSKKENVNNKVSILDRLEQHKQEIGSAAPDRTDRYKEHNNERN